MYNVDIQFQSTDTALMIDAIHEHVKKNPRIKIYIGYIPKLPNSIFTKGMRVGLLGFVNTLSLQNMQKMNMFPCFVTEINIYNINFTAENISLFYEIKDIRLRDLRNKLDLELFVEMIPSSLRRLEIYEKKNSHKDHKKFFIELYKRKLCCEGFIVSTDINTLNEDNTRNYYMNIENLFENDESVTNYLYGYISSVDEKFLHINYTINY